MLTNRPYATIAPEKQIDVRGGRCSYGQMIELGRVFERQAKREVKLKDTEIIKQLINILHPDICPDMSFDNVKYAERIAEGVRFWREKEAVELAHEPSADEKAAGYSELAAATGPSGVASTIAEKFGNPAGPDAIFDWPYSTVFMVLRIDLKRHKYQKKLAEVYEAKRKMKDGSKRRR